jgi:hypothetical protein
MTVSCRILLRMRHVLDKSCKANQNTHFMLNNLFSENRAVCEIISKTVVKPERPLMAM